MRRRSQVAILATALACCCALWAPVAVAGGPLDYLTPTEVRVQNGQAWHARPSFYVSWSRLQVGGATSPTPLLTDYLVRDMAGTVVVPRQRFPWDGDKIAQLAVPAVPGVYVAELWLEGEAPLEGPHGTAVLRLDNARPDPPEAAATAAWFGGGDEPSLRIEGPSGPPPISGIRGYAVSIDRDGAGSPCADPETCTNAEIDLPAADSPGTLPLGTLPEGPSVVRVGTVSNSGMRSRALAKVEVRIDLTAPAVVLGGVPDGWAREPVRLTAKARDALSGMAPAGAGGPSTAIAVDDGAAAIAPGDSVTSTVSGDGVHTVAYSARDAAGNSSPVGSDSPPAPGTAVVRIDESAPQVSFVRSQDPSEPERLEARVGDRLSGPDPDHGSIAVRPAGSTVPFRQLATTVAGDRLTAVWDSDSDPAGSYEFRATGYDRAGNSTTTDRRADGARMVLANPLKQSARIEFGFGGRQLVWQRCSRVGERRRCRRQVIEAFGARPAERATGYGHRTGVAGRLESAKGAPLPGMPVEIVETFDAGSTVGARTTTVQTDADGRFSARLAPGPSRRIEAAFGGNRVLSRAGATALRLRVLASVRLHASSATATIGGRPIVFSGRVDGLGARIPADGRPVDLQFRLPGRPWSEFRTVQTDARGRFSYAYAFADDDSRGVRFQFRAVAPAAEGWPYDTAASRPVFVTGR